MPKSLLKLDTHDRASLYARFVLSNSLYPTDALIAEGLTKTPKVFIDTQTWPEDVAARLLRVAGVEEKERGTRAWNTRAQALVEAVIASASAPPRKLKTFDELAADDTGRCLFPSVKLPSYALILHATAGMVCIDASSREVSAKFSQRPLHTILITAALVAEAWQEFFHREDAAVRNVRLDAILEAALGKLRGSVGAQWFEKFLAIDVKDGSTAKSRAWLRSPVTWYAAAASYAGYGYCLQQSTARVSQALALEREATLERDATATAFQGAQRVPPDWLEVFILETTFQRRAPVGMHPKEFAKLQGEALVYASESRAWAPLEALTVAEDAEALHSMAIVPHAGRTQARTRGGGGGGGGGPSAAAAAAPAEELRAHVDDSDFAQLAAQASTAGPTRTKGAGGGVEDQRGGGDGSGHLVDAAPASQEV